MTTISISGWGIGAPLAACCVAACVPGARILLFCDDQNPQHGLEPVVLDNLPAPVRDAIEPLVVRQWDAFSIVLHGEQSRHSAEIALIDPLQLGLELDRLRDRIAVRRGDVARRGEAAGALHFEVTSRPEHPTSSVLRADATRELAAPVLADFDIAAASGLALQYFTLAGGDVLVRHCVLHGDGESPALGPALDKDGSGAILAGAILRATATANLAIDQARDFIERFELR